MIRSIAIALLAAALLAGCTGASSKPEGGVVSTEAKNTTPTGLKYTVLHEGKQDGTVAQKGDTVEVNYTGWLPDGTKFDSSVDRREPFQFTLGEGKVIQGWEQGVLGMKVGEKRKLVIPPDLGYGSRAAGPIPANSTLIFEVELLDVKRQ